MLSISFALSDESGTILSGSETLADDAAVERFISTTMPGWAQALRNTARAHKAVSLTTTSAESLPDQPVAKMLSSDEGRQPARTVPGVTDY
jgi:hypothetical protein